MSLMHRSPCTPTTSGRCISSTAVSGSARWRPFRSTHHRGDPCIPAAAVRDADVAAVAAVSHAPDPFVQAAQRLQSLLAGAGEDDGEDELIQQHMEHCSPETKLGLQATGAGLLLAGAYFVTLLTGVDPLGGATLSVGTLEAMAVGAAVALPVASARAWTWSPDAAEAVPSLDGIHAETVEVLSPWLTNMSAWHVAVAVLMEVVPNTLMLLPAAQASLLASLALVLKTTAGPDAMAALPPHLAELGCLAVTASVAGMGKGLEQAVTDSELTVVSQAVDNSDRFYRVMATDATTRPANAQQAAVAFRAVAQAWLLVRTETAWTSAALSFCDAMLLGGLWYATGNLAAPMVLALVMYAVDYHHVWQIVLRKEAKALRFQQPPSGGGDSNNQGKNGGKQPSRAED